jgi:hypothetical protein
MANDWLSHPQRHPVWRSTGQWMMFKVPLKTMLYSLAAGLVEMLILGIWYGLAMRPG